MKNLKTKDIILTLIVIAIFFVPFFIIQPYTEKIYLNEDINYFKEYHFWKIYFLGWSLVLISFIIFKYKFTLERFAMIFFYFICFYLTFQRIGTHTFLYINQIFQTKTERKVYKLYNDKKYLQLFLDDEKEDNLIFKDEIDKINIVRKKKNLKEIQDLPTHDSVCVDYKVGIFGIKYLK